METKNKKFPDPLNPFGVILALVGIACIIGGIYLYLHGGNSTGYQTSKYTSGSVHGLNGVGIIFFGVLFFIIGALIAKPKNED